MAKIASNSERKHRQQLSLKTRNTIIVLRSAKLTYEQIMKMLNLKKSTVATVCQKAAKGVYDVQARSGRPRILNEGDHTYLKQQLSCEPDLPLVNHWQRFKSNVKPVSYDTFRQAVHDLGF